MRARRAFALIDYICGSMILATTMAAITSVNLTKFRTFAAARHRQRALYLASGLLQTSTARLSSRESQRALAARLRVAGEAWIELEDMAPEAELRRITHNAQAQVEARLAPGIDGGIELRVTVLWGETNPPTSELAVATLVMVED